MSYNFIKILEPKDISEIESFLKRDRTTADYNVQELVFNILEDIKNNGEKALFEYCRKYDGITVENIRDLKVSEDEIIRAGEAVPKKYPRLVEAISRSFANLKHYHKAQLDREPKTWFINPDPGRKLGQLIAPVERAGLYVPGGRYLYPSSVLMCAVPAKIAGVKNIAVCTPPQKDGSINEVLLYLFSFLNINEIYKIGGAQAIAAFTFGTENIKKVDKIIGPGNIYVTAAKKLVYGIVGIDSLAGPSEVLIIADEKANPSYIASDLLSQAEHDPDASGILLTTSREVAENVLTEIYSQLESMQKIYKNRINRNLIINTLGKKCKIFLNSSIDFLIDISNLIAPEHLEVVIAEPEAILSKIKNAGAIFIGENTPVSAGDYICGTNHVIPTEGNARFSSPLGVYDFFKRSSVAYYSRESFLKEAEYIETFADFENLLAHKNSVSVRYKKVRYKK